MTWEKVKVVFTLSNSTGFVGYASAVEDPALTSVTAVTLQEGNPSAQGQVGQPYWSGYQFAGNADNTVSVWEAIGQWAVPSAQPPQQGCSNFCSMLAWAGLTHDQVGSHIAQAGSADTINSLGGVHYFLWYEFYPTMPQIYDCYDMGWYGDTIQATVVNQAANPGGNSALYNIYDFDLSLNQGCTSVTGYNFGAMGVPHYGNFIVEDTQNGNGGVYTLPQFSTFSMTGNVYYSGATRGIYTPYSNGWYTEYVMQPCTGCASEVVPGTVGSTNSFTQTWYYSAT